MGALVAEGTTDVSDETDGCCAELGVFVCFESGVEVGEEGGDVGCELVVEGCLCGEGVELEPEGMKRGRRGECVPVARAPMTINVSSTIVDVLLETSSRPILIVMIRLARG